MDRITSFVANMQVPSSFLNDLQDRTFSLARPAGSLEIAGMTRVSRAVINQFANDAGGNSVPATNYKAIDQTANGFDWRTCYVEGWIATIGGDNDRIGGSAEQYINTYLRDAKHFVGYLGTGSTTAFDRAAGDYFIEADWSGGPGVFNVYANPADGELRVYNTAGINTRCIVMVHALGKKP